MFSILVGKPVDPQARRDCNKAHPGITCGPRICGPPKTVVVLVNNDVFDSTGEGDAWEALGINTLMAHREETA